MPSFVAFTQMAGWSIYPSRYEGFGFPILEPLRHGMPSWRAPPASMCELTTPAFISSTHMIPAPWTWRGSGFITPKSAPSRRPGLTSFIAWISWPRPSSMPTRFAASVVPPDILLDCPSISADRDPAVLPISGPRQRHPAASGRLRESTSVSDRSRPRPPATIAGSGRYPKSCFRAPGTRPGQQLRSLLRQGLLSDQLPKAANAEIRLLRPEPAHGEASLVDALTRLITTNPDATDVFLLLNARESGSGYALPAKTSNGLKVAALIHDLLPLFCHRDSCTGRPGQERPQPDVESLSRLASYNALLVTSEANRESLVFLLKGSAERVVTIGTAADDRFFVPDESGAIPGEAQALFQKLGIAGPFVLSVGSMEYHSTDHSQRLIEAFAMLPVKLHDAHQLVLTYDLSPQARTACQSVCFGARRRSPVGSHRPARAKGASIVIPAVCRLRLADVV